MWWSLLMGWRLVTSHSSSTRSTVSRWSSSAFCAVRAVSFLPQQVSSASPVVKVMPPQAGQT